MEVQYLLGGSLRDEPAKLDEVLSLPLDGAVTDAEDVRDPGRLDAALRLRFAAPEATNQVTKDGGDKRAAGAAACDEAEHVSRHGHHKPLLLVGDPSQGAVECFGHEAKLARVGRELDG